MAFKGKESVTVWTATLVSSVFSRVLEGKDSSIEGQGCEIKASLPKAQLHT